MLRPVALAVCCAAASVVGAETAEAQGDGDDGAVAALLSQLDVGALGREEAQDLLVVALEHPGRISALGRSPRDVQLRSLAAASHGRIPFSPVGMAFVLMRDGHPAAGDSLFDAAFQSASSDAQRADYLYARATNGLGDRADLIDRALTYDPTHGPSLYTRVGLFADRVGRPSTAEGRAAYWCLADAYRRVVGVVESESIARATHRAATAYERAAPPPSAFGGAGWREGDQITVTYGDGETCTTRVR